MNTSHVTHTTHLLSLSRWRIASRLTVGLGVLALLLSLPQLGWAQCSSTFLFQFGSGGSGNGQFSQPYRVAVDAAGNIYVADTGNNRIEVFISAGQFLFSFGSSGNGPGQFNPPPRRGRGRGGQHHCGGYQ